MSMALQRPVVFARALGGEPAEEAARAVRIVQAGRGMSLAGDPGRDMGGEESPCGPRGSEFRGEPQGTRIPGVPRVQGA